VNYLPISKEQDSRTGLLPSGFLYFLAFSIFISISTSILADPLKPLVRLKFHPVVTDEIKERQKTTDLGGPLGPSTIRELGIHNVEGLISDADLSMAFKTLDEKYFLPPGSPSNLLFSLIASKVLAMQTRSADWHANFRRERIEFVDRELSYRAQNLFKKDPWKARRAYILRLINKEARIPFALEKLVNAEGLLDAKALEKEFSKIKTILRMQKLDVDKEFNDYIQTICGKWNEFIKESPQGFKASWKGYRLLSQEPDLEIRLRKPSEVNSKSSVSMAILSLVEAVDSAIRQHAKRTPIQAFEIIYGYFLLNPETEIDLNAPREYNQSIYSELGATRVPPQLIRPQLGKEPIDQFELSQLIFDTFNPVYLDEIFNQEFVAWGERSSSRYRGTKYKVAGIDRPQIEQFYRERTDGKSPDQRYQKRFRIRFVRADLELPSDFERAKVNQYFANAYAQAFSDLGEKMSARYEKEAAARGFKDLESAAKEGFSFPQSQEELPDARQESFSRFVAEIAPHLLAKNVQQQEFILEGSWEEIQQSANLLFGDGSSRVSSFLNEFRKKELTGSGKRSLLSIENELVETPEQLHLYVWTVPEAKVLEHLPLFGPNPYLYSDIERELASGIWDESFRLLFEELFATSFDYLAHSDSKMGETFPTKQDLFKSLKGSDIPSILKNAAYLAHDQISQSGDWRREVFIRRKAR